MHDLLYSDRAHEALGPAYTIGLEAADRLEEEIEAIALAAGSQAGLERARAQVAEFAAQHPIEDLDFTRVSAAPELSQVTEEARKGVLDTVRTLEGRIDDLTARLTIYAAHTPRQARWEAEVFTEHLFALPEMARLVALPQEVPQLVSQEREIVLDTLRAEREAVLVNVERQRLDTQAFVSGERDAVLAAVTSEREAIVTALADERRAVLEDVERQRADTLAMVREERLATLAWAEEQREVLLADVVREANTTIDRVLWRSFLYALALVGGPVLLLGLALLIARGRVSVDLTKHD
jgi:hypothetical protein